jgi:hypothetical protein
VRLDLAVAGEDAEAELGALIEAEGEDALRQRDPKGGECLAGDGDLGPHQLQLPLRCLHHVQLGGDHAKHVVDVLADRSHRYTPRQLRPLEHAELVQLRLVAPALVAPSRRLLQFAERVAAAAARILRLLHQLIDPGLDGDRDRDPREIGIGIGRL